MIFISCQATNKLTPGEIKPGRCVRPPGATHQCDLEGITRIYEYGYDLAGRLETVKEDGLDTRRYGYDGNNNRNRFNGVLVGEYDAQDRLLRYGGNTYTYTANGELQTKTVAGQTVTVYNYDVLGNLRTVDLPGGTQIEYIIDSKNRRIGKKINGILVQGFLYNWTLDKLVQTNGNIQTALSCSCSCSYS